MVIVFRSGTRSDPGISSVRNSDHDYLFRLPVGGSRTPNQFLGVVVHTIAMSGLSCVRTELFCCS